MPRPALFVNQSDSLIQIIDINSQTEWQTVQILISWLLQKPTDLDLHYLLGQGMSCLAREGLTDQYVVVMQLWIQKSQNVYLEYQNSVTKTYTIKNA